MQNSVNHYIRNGSDCFFPHLVTYRAFGNSPANGLVTEILQCFTFPCFGKKSKSLIYKPIKFNSHRFVSACFCLYYSLSETHFCHNRELFNYSAHIKQLVILKISIGNG